MRAGARGLRRRVAYLTQTPSVYSDLTVRENLEYFATILGAAATQIDVALERVALAALQGRLVRRQKIAGSKAVLALLCLLVALLGMGLWLLASAFARTEFQVVQFFPALITPQLLLCGLLIPRAQMQSALHAISDAMPMSYAVDAVRHLGIQRAATLALWGDLAIVVAFAVAAILLGAATLRRRGA